MKLLNNNPIRTKIFLSDTSKPRARCDFYKKPNTNSAMRFVECPMDAVYTDDNLTASSTDSSDDRGGYDLMNTLANKYSLFNGRLSSNFWRSGGNGMFCKAGSRSVSDVNLIRNKEIKLFDDNQSNFHIKSKTLKLFNSFE